MFDKAKNDTIPMVESHLMDQEIVTEFSLEDKNFISKMSNKVSEYEETPNKQVSNSGSRSHRSPTKSEIEKSIKNSLRMGSSKKEEPSDSMFEIEVVLDGQLYKRKFSSL